MYFEVTSTVKNLLFKGLDITSPAGIVAACIVIALVTFILEGFKALMLYWTTRLKQHPLTYGKTDNHVQDRSPLFASLTIPSSIEQIKQRRIKYHCYSFLTHVFNVIVGYFLMLAVMSYNLWILIAVIFGSGLGHFIFGALSVNLRTKYSLLAVSPETSFNSETDTTSSRDHLVT